jgi:dynein heavy chain
VWLSGLINPQSFLTAIAQQTAQRNSLELDKLVIQTDVTKKMAGEMEAASRDGAYVSGFFLSGCRWDVSAGQLDKSKPREMFCPMHVINCKAVPADKLDEKGAYRCPVYIQDGAARANVRVHGSDEDQDAACEMDDERRGSFAGCR